MNVKKRIKSFLLAGLLIISCCMTAITDTLEVRADASDEENGIIVQVGSGGYHENGEGWGESGSIFSNDGATKARYNSTRGGSALWTAVTEKEGIYEVYIWRVNNTYSYRLNLQYTGGENQVVDWSGTQEAGWVRLGEADYEAGQEVSVIMSNPEGGMMRTAAVKFVPKTSGTEQPELEEKLTVDTSDGNAYYEEITGEWKDSGVTGYAQKGTRYSLSEKASVEWKPVVKDADEYSVRLYHPVHYSDVENEVKIEVIDAEGSVLKTETVVWYGTDTAGWIDLGSYELPAGQITVRVTKTDRLENPNNPGENYHDQALRADAVQLVKKTESADLIQMPNDTYYVDATGGDDENSGTSPEQAWKTLDKINGCEFAPGSSILLKKGEAWTGKLSPKGSGTKEEPILLGSYGQGDDRPAVHGNGCDDGAVELYNQEYWEITGLEVTNMAPGETLGNEDTADQTKNLATRHGIYVVLENFDTEGDNTADHIYIKDCEVHNVAGSLSHPHKGVGIFFYVDNSGDKSRFNDILIEGNSVYDVDRSGIIRSQDTSDPDTTYNTNVIIQKNYLENIGGDGIVAKVSKAPLIQYNECNRACARPTWGNANNAAVWVWQCKDAVIQYNEVYNTGLKGGNKDGQAFDSDFNCEGTVIQYNYSHDNDGGFVLLIAPSAKDYNRGTAVRYNISQNDKKDIIEISGGVETAKIYNNTIYQDLEEPTTLLRINTYFAVPKDEVLFANNIFCSVYEGAALEQTDNGRPLRGNICFDTNLFYGYIEPESADRAVNDYGTDGNLYTGHWTLTVRNSLNENPKLANPGSGGTGVDFADDNRLAGYWTTDGSPCVNAGRLIEENGGQDFWGNVLYAGRPDIGAYETEVKAEENPGADSKPGISDAGNGQDTNKPDAPGNTQIPASGKTEITAPHTGGSMGISPFVITILSGLVLAGTGITAVIRKNMAHKR